MIVEKAAELRQLEELARRLEKIIENAETVEITDFYKDYRTGYPKIKTLCGVDFDNEHINRQKRQLKRIRGQIDRIKGHMRSELDLIKDPDERKILKYHFVDGLSYRQIASKLFISKSTVERKVKLFKKMGQLGQ